MNNIEQYEAPEGSGCLESLKQRFTEWQWLKAAFPDFTMHKVVEVFCAKRQGGLSHIF